jgi:CubicO group peptidase (beta-lactamase class C family)
MTFQNDGANISLYTLPMKQLAAVVVFIFWVIAQPLLACSEDHAQQVDQIFATYNRSGSPGCSLGVIRKGAFLYRKSYGEASLELGVPLSPDSVFYVGSVSKQFTAASVVLAAEQGFVSLDEDVRKYIPELPDYGRTITLRQMLNQTSGLRDFFNLIYFAGHAPADFNEPGDILNLVARQRGLNNLPGNEWVYSNTNYFLLGVALQRATKKTLAEFAADNIFHPLEMTHTRFYDDASAVVQGRVAAYDAGEHGNFLVDWSTTYAVVGGGGVMTSIDDLLKWDENFYSDRLDKGVLVKELETPGILSDGKRTTYGMGLIVGNYRGLPVVEHDGALFGYRADVLRFPEQKFTVICLCNASNANPELRSREVADLYLKDDMQGDAMAGSSSARNLPDPTIFTGEYLDPRTHTIYSFTAADGKLQGWGSNLRRKDTNEFYDLFGDVITFQPAADSMKVMLDMNGEAYFAGKRIVELHLSGAALKEFAGEYRSREVDGAIQLSLEKEQLLLKIGSNPPVKLSAIANDEFNAEGSFVVVIHRDSGGKVSGLSVFAAAARGIAYDRTN